VPRLRHFRACPFSFRFRHKGWRDNNSPSQSLITLERESFSSILRVVCLALDLQVKRGECEKEAENAAMMQKKNKEDLYILSRVTNTISTFMNDNC
jgi:hypothetical protein